MRELIRHILKEQPQLDEIDKKLYNFLLRRIRINERNIGGYTDDDNPIKVKEYSFEDLPGYGFTDYYSKKEMEKTIIDMFWENDVIDFYPYELDERDPKRVRIIKTIRHFLNHTL
jgi:hypothetical protein